MTQTGAQASASAESRAFDATLLRHQLRHTGVAALRMQGKSMSPLLPEGVRVTLRPVQTGEPLRGAIVAVDVGPMVVVHRVVEAAGATVVTQGLRARLPDRPVSRSSVIGVVCGRDGWPIFETHLRAAAWAWTLSIRSLRALRSRW